MSYLIFNNKADAIARADLEGQRVSLPYHIDGGVTRYMTYPVETSNGKWALDVTDYELSVAENLTKKNSFSEKTLSDGQEF